MHVYIYQFFSQGKILKVHPHCSIQNLFICRQILEFFSASRRLCIAFKSRVSAFFHFLLHIYLYICMSMYEVRRVSDVLKLKLQAVVSYLMWVLGMKSMPYTRTVCVAGRWWSMPLLPSLGRQRDL